MTKPLDITLVYQNNEQTAALVSLEGHQRVFPVNASIDAVLPEYALATDKKAWFKERIVQQALFHFGIPGATVNVIEDTSKIGEFVEKMRLVEQDWQKNMKIVIGKINLKRQGLSPLLPVDLRIQWLYTEPVSGLVYGGTIETEISRLYDTVDNLIYNFVNSVKHAFGGDLTSQSLQMAVLKHYGVIS